MKQKTGLFFGSFNPVHTGHMIVAAYMREFTDLDQVWFVVSPQNPLKDKSSLLPDHHRLMLLKTAIENDPAFKVSDIEFKMPKPSYTIDTLTWLSEKYPERDFVLIAGTDILDSFHKWKNYQVLLEYYSVYIYSRPGFDAGKYTRHSSIKFIDAPLMEISSSFIRNAISKGKDVRYMLPPRVWEYIKEMHFYEK
ncbi:MAG: nicotinate-nucleotide adenylyltransferase [Bacteroidales bacterium]|nr:nicotinate-nucleotide adenylyltransferase [Bacteroidales bacterium]